MTRSLSLSSTFLILTTIYASAGAKNTFSLGTTANTNLNNNIRSSIGRSSLQKRNGDNSKLGSKLLDIRGGSTKSKSKAKVAAPVVDNDTDPAESEESLLKKKKQDELQAYRLQQQLYLQSRSLQLRQALIARGLTALQHGAVEEGTVSRHVDWDCAMATKEHSKSCLYSFDAEIGSKVVAPIGTDQWITLSALNRLRRTDPTKVEPLWHSQYSILKTWLSPSDKYSLYNYLTPAGTLLSYILDAPVVLASCMLVIGLLGLLVTLPFWESLVQTILTHPLVWTSWPNWGRFVHAALPLKLLLGQLAWRGMATIFFSIYTNIRDRLIEWECQIWEDAMPLTILEGRNYAAAAAARGDSEDDDEITITDTSDEDE
jgi:Skp family chaperone for outer membrane proteins